jgi:hypothetical protein
LTVSFMRTAVCGGGDAPACVRVCWLQGSLPWTSERGAREPAVKGALALLHYHHHVSSSLTTPRPRQQRRAHPPP